MNSLYAQNARFSMELYGGLPTPLTFFTPSISTFGGVGVKYALLKEVSIGGQFTIGTLSGKNNSANSTLVFPDNNNNYSSFTNNFYQYTIEGQINLERIFNLRRVFHRINPYLVVGGGIIHTDVKADNINGTKRAYPDNNFYTMYSGLLVKYYLNPSLDFILGTNFNMSQTYYNDAVPIDRKMDNYLMTYVGVACKFGARKDKQHIEWNNVILNDRIYIPDIEKRQGQPIDAAGNFFVFHKDSIAKLQAQNLVLIAKAEKLEAKDVAQQQQIDSMQTDVQEMKTMMDTLQNQVKQLKEQMNNNKSGNEENNKTVVPNPDKKDNQNNKAAKPKPSSSVKQDAKPSVKDATSTKDAEKTENAVTGSTADADIPSNELTKNLNTIDGITAPVARYNIIVGAYLSQKYAYIFRDQMRAKGYEAAIFKTGANSRMLRVCIFTSEDKTEAIKVMRKARSEVNPGAWMHIYNQK